MNENPETNVQYVSPLKRICMTIGELPASYLETMSYYEMLVWFTNFLQNTVIPTIDNNALATQELQTLYIELRDYVNNYFDDLDIQEEINNKLDEMAEDGSLTNLIKDYIDPIQNQYEIQINNIVASQNQEINSIRNEVESISNGSPIPVSNVSDMTDTSRLYLLLSDGYVYYYNGSVFTQGWIYQATGVSDSDPVIEDINNQIENLETHYKNLLNDELIVKNKIINDSGNVVTDNTGAYYNQYIEVNENECVIFNYGTTQPGATRRIYYFDENKNIVSRPTITNNEIKVIPSDIHYVTIQINKNDYNCMLLKASTVQSYSSYYTSNDKYGREILNSNIKDSYNILNPVKRYSGHIIDNSGSIVTDNTGCFYNEFIDSSTNKTFTLTFNTTLPTAKRRVYCFDSNKDIIERPEIYNGIAFTVGDTTDYIMIQTHVSDTNVMLVKGSYKLPFMSYGKLIVDKELRNILNKDFPKSITHLYPVWEPTTTTNAFESTSSYNNTNLEYSYQDLLDNYFEPYIYQSYTNYNVEKHTLGQDSANSYYEMFYYIFEPKDYKYTILISGGMNSCELSPIFGIAYFINALMTSTDESVKALHDSVRFVILPVICPSSFEQTNKKYLNYNGVRINKNFNYLKSWDVVSTDGRGTKGAYPDSENETKALKKWINMFPNANLWMDCHADLEATTQRLFDTICSTQNVINKITPVQTAMQDYYYDKGYFNDPSALQNRNRVEQNTQYPKTLYAQYILNIPSIMVEQFAKCTAYGASGTLQCEDNSIKNYVTMLIQYSIAMIKE